MGVTGIVGEVAGGTTPPVLPDDPELGCMAPVAWSDDDPDGSTDEGKLSGSSYCNNLVEMLVIRCSVRHC